MLAEMCYVSAKDNEHQVWEYKNATFCLQCFFQIFKIVPLELKWIELICYKLPISFLVQYIVFIFKQNISHQPTKNLIN